MTSDSSLAKAFRVKSGTQVRLSDIDPRDSAWVDGEADARASLVENTQQINVLQDRLYAEGARSLLVVLQGMDTSGKDGTVRGVFNDTGPMGVTVHPFRAPCGDETTHDYLWRAHAAAPRKGMIAIFNRSHYEDVLIGRVRKLAPHHVIEQRYDQINAFEKILTENGTVILKFMLHISKDEQRERLQERLDHPDKHWKFQPSDLDDRKLWKEYMEAYEIMLSRCSTEWAPWHVIPADRKWARNAAIAAIVLKTLAEMAPKYPQPSWKPGDFKID